MALFFAMAAAGAALAVASAARLLRSRFLHPTDVAVLSTFYYAVPLAVCGYLLFNPRDMIFLHRAAADPALAVRAMHYALAAMIALHAGSWAMRATRDNGPAPCFLATYFKAGAAGQTRAWAAAGLLVVLMGAGILQFGTAEFFEGYASESDAAGATLGIALVYFAVSAFGMIIAYALILKRVDPDRPVFWLIATVSACALFVLLARSKRLEIVIAFLPMAIILLSRRKSLTITVGRLAIGGAAVALLVVLAALRINEAIDPFAFGFYLFSEGLYAGHALPGIVQRLDAGMLGYENGVRFVSAFLAFVPRVVWPGKDDFVYAGNHALDGVAPLGATSFLAETVLQGGLVAVVLVHFALGMVFEWSTRFERVWDAALASGYIPRRFIAYLVLIAVFIPHFRDGIIPAIKLSLQAAAFLVLLTGLHRVPGWVREGRALALRHHRAGAG